MHCEFVIILFCLLLKLSYILQERQDCPMPVRTVNISSFKATLPVLFDPGLLGYFCMIVK
jgi:hypothetical protein